MKDKKEDLISKVTQLTKKLTQLGIQKRRLEDRLTRVQRKLEHKSSAYPTDPDQRVAYYQVVKDGDDEHIVIRKRRATHTKQRQQPLKLAKERAYNRETLPEIGDKVRIVNPKPGQRDQGTVEGFYVDGKPKIRTGTNTVITRQPKNVRYYVTYY